MTEDKMTGWHHGLNGHGFEQVLGDGEGQGSLACCSPWGRRELDMSERLTTVSKGLPLRLSGGRACNAGDVGSIPGLGRPPGEGNDTPPQCSCLGNPRDRGAWWATVHGLAKSGTRLSH